MFDGVSRHDGNVSLWISRQATSPAPRPVSGLRPILASASIKSLVPMKPAERWPSRASMFYPLFKCCLWGCDPDDPDDDIPDDDISTATMLHHIWITPAV